MKNEIDKDFEYFYNLGKGFLLGFILGAVIGGCAVVIVQSWN